MKTKHKGRGGEQRRYFDSASIYVILLPEFGVGEGGPGYKEEEDRIQQNKATYHCQT